MFKKLFGQLQRIGKSINASSCDSTCCRFILAIGTALQGDSLQHYLPFIKNGIVQQVATMMTGAGGIILIIYQSYSH